MSFFLIELFWYFTEFHHRRGVSMEIFAPGWKNWPKFKGEMPNPVGMPDSSPPAALFFFEGKEHLHEIDSEKLIWKAVAIPISTILLR